MGGVICWEVCYFLRSQCLGVFGFAIQDSNGRAKRPRRLFPWVFEVKWLIFGRFLGFCHDAASVARALRCVLKIQLRTPEGRRVARLSPRPEWECVSVGGIGPGNAGLCTRPARSLWKTATRDWDLKRVVLPGFACEFSWSRALSRASSTPFSPHGIGISRLHCPQAE